MKKNYNILLYSFDNELKLKAVGKSISFGTLGVYVFGQPKLLPTPPMALPPPPQPMMAASSSSNLTILSPEDCKRALANWANSQTCANKNIATEGTVVNVMCFNDLEVDKIF
jgi:hypothetical protein